ncbi:GrpB family protein [Jeotgalibacillus salarius]|uniref:GrpB family protein n=1 Tax=Jeotgalibacillus salarius TaxID=546023 RepID=A0A4Y8LHI2_9BACL|nr:GrpB family protein [Jeotgalibacillus salarius]TFE02286.1 GrpB family protein [Jeotgalibacillus salarius]
MKVIVSSYNNDWVRLYEEEAEKIMDIFRDQLLDIHHIGSTSVPGLQAKPIIDILPILKNVKEADRQAHQMEMLGYESMGEYGLSGRRYFRKGGEQRTHHVHMYDVSSQYEIDRHLAFRDYLREHPQEAASYGALKVRLSRTYPNDIEAYIEGKNNVIKLLERKALGWRR